MSVAAEVNALATGDVALEGRGSKIKAQMWKCSFLVVAISRPTFAGSLPLLCVVLVSPYPSHCRGEDRGDAQAQSKHRQARAGAGNLTSSEGCRCGSAVGLSSASWREACLLFLYEVQ